MIQEQYPLTVAGSLVKDEDRLLTDVERGIMMPNDSVRFIIVHCSATRETQDYTADQLRGAIITLLIELKRKFPNAMIRGHNEMPGSVPKACPCYCPSKEYAYLMK